MSIGHWRAWSRWKTPICMALHASSVPPVMRSRRATCTADSAVSGRAGRGGRGQSGLCPYAQAQDPEVAQ
jgi:hypothetical protein